MTREKPRDSESSSSTRSAAIVAASIVALLFGAAVMIRGCVNTHGRSHGHNDITFGISPAGDRLVFNGVGEGGGDLFLLELKTARVTRIAATPEYEADPEFSPDGESVVYSAGKPGDRADHIFLRSLDGRSVRQLTTADANDASPAFSPDGSTIVFTRDKTYNWGGLASNWDAGGVLCVMKTDGTGGRQVTSDGTMAIDPHFSPDGRTILFWNEDGLFTVRADGSESPQPLGVPGGRQGCYSPDGETIAFSRGEYAPDLRIFIAHADGSAQRKLSQPVGCNQTRPNGGRSCPAFTPDGKRLVFFLESWTTTGLSEVPKESLWESDVEDRSPREIVDFTLFDAPLEWNKTN